MTLFDKIGVLKVLSHADGGCSYCVGNLVEYVMDEFPQDDWRAVRDQLEWFFLKDKGWGVSPADVIKEIDNYLEVLAE